MASNQISLEEAKLSLPIHDLEMEKNDFHYKNGPQWLRVIVLGVVEGLISVSSLLIIMSVGAVRHDIKAMILTGLAGLLIGACCLAIGEFLSTHSQLDMELSQRMMIMMVRRDQREERGERKSLPSGPSPWKAAAASAVSFSAGAVVPLLAGSFIREYRVRVGVVFGVVSLALVVFGWLGSELGRAPNKVRSSLRFLVGGWLAMAITCGLTKLIDALIEPSVQ